MANGADLQSLCAVIDQSFRSRNLNPCCDQREKDLKIFVLLRLAVVLHSRRSEPILPDINMKVEEQRIRLRVPKNWLEAHQLTATDFDQQASYLKAAGTRLKEGRSRYVAFA